MQCCAGEACVRLCAARPFGSVCLRLRSFRFCRSIGQRSGSGLGSSLSIPPFEFCTRWTAKAIPWLGGSMFEVFRLGCGLGVAGAGTRSRFPSHIARSLLVGTVWLGVKPTVFPAILQSSHHSLWLFASHQLGWMARAGLALGELPEGPSSVSRVM